MRASSRRAHHSTVSGPVESPGGRGVSPKEAGLNRPWTAKPACSSTARPTATFDGVRAHRSASSAAVTGPDRSRWPRSTAAATCSTGTGPSARSSMRTRASAADSVAHHRSMPSAPVSEPTRPRAASSSKSGRQAGRAGVTTRPDNRSWRSSAVLGSGVTSARTRAMASGSSRPMVDRSTGRPRRSGTALVRRSTASASSRKA